MAENSEIAEVIPEEAEMSEREELAKLIYEAYGDAESDPDREAAAFNAAGRILAAGWRRIPAPETPEEAEAVNRMRLVAAKRDGEWNKPTKEAMRSALRAALTGGSDAR